MPWLRVNQTRLRAVSAVPTPLLALEVHRAGMPGDPGAGGCTDMYDLAPRAASHSRDRRRVGARAENRRPGDDGVGTGFDGEPGIRRVLSAVHLDPRIEAL